MIKKFGQWLGGKEEELSEEQKLREISLEYEESELIEATQNFHTSRRLGSGNYGCVYRGTLPDGHEVAIKVLDVDEENDSTSGFMHEVRVLSKFRHPNLVTLMGWGMGSCEEEGKVRRFLVYELLSGGDVAQRLESVRTPGGKPFTWKERLWVALDAASGLSHMHNSTPKAFHRDIKSANILLDRSGTAKMADFGLSGIAKNKEKLNMTCEQISGTPGYACPHYIKSGKVTEQTEVYAFGMVMLELLMNSMPACLGQGGKIVYPIFQVVMPGSPGALERALAAVDPKAGWPNALAQDLAEFALKCSSLKEDQRPLFTEVGRHLRQLIEQFCNGQRAVPATEPKLASSAPQLGGANPPTMPQMGLSWDSPAAQKASQGVELPTCPQMGLGGSSGPAPTRPQMHVPGLPAAGAALGASAATRPQLAPGAAAPTRPQMGVPPPGTSAPGDLATRPQLPPGGPAGGPAPTRPQMGLGPAAGPGGPQATRPQLGVGGGTPAQPPRGELATRPQLGVPGMGLQPRNPLADLATRPQLPPGPGAGANPTRPQLGPGPGPGPGFGAGGNPTRPQLGPAGPGGDLATRPQLGGGPALGGGAAPTRPQMGHELPTRPQLGLGGGGGYPAAGGGVGAGAAGALGAIDEAQQLQIPQSASNTSAQPTGWHYTGSAPHTFVCVMAYGSDVERMPLENRTFGLLSEPPGAPIMVGRLHQPWYFEGLLNKEPGQRYLCCVSRSHLEVVPGPGCFSVTNQSANPVVLPGRQRLEKGDRGTVRFGECVEFICHNADGSGEPITYLKLRLEQAGGSRARTEPEYGRLPVTQPAWTPSPPMQPQPQQQQQPPPPQSQPPPQQHQQAAPPQPPAAPSQQPQGPPATSSRSRSPAPASAAAAPLLPAMQDSVQELPPFWLVLAGTAVRASFPTAQRRLEGRVEGLTVGRAHQQALHANAFEQDVRQYLSRDHFRIECGRDRQCRLVPLSSNPLWRLRGGRRQEAVIGEPALPLAHGDEVVLFTGAEDCTPDGPGNLGSLRWVFHDAAAMEEDSVIDGPTRRAVPRRQTPEALQAPAPAASSGEKDRNCFVPWPGARGWGGQEQGGGGGGQSRSITPRRGPQGQGGGTTPRRDTTP